MFDDLHCIVFGRFLLILFRRAALSPFEERARRSARRRFLTLFLALGLVRM